MDHSADSIRLLDQLEQPAFIVEENTIRVANTYAASRGFTAGQDITPLLDNQFEAYTTMPHGHLYLTLTAGTVKYNADITRTEQYDIFKLQAYASDPALSALSVAAQSLKMALSDALLSAADLDGSQSPSLQRNLVQLHRSLCNMSDAINIENKRIHKLTFVNIPELFREIMEKAAAYLEAAHVTLRYTGLNQNIYSQIDEDKLIRGVLNLLLNAAKYGVHGTPIEAQLSYNKGKVSFSVMNKARESLGAIHRDLFSAFKRPHDVIIPGSGIGLGMTIARGAALAHNGSLLCDQPDHNTLRVTITIPVTKEQVLPLHSDMLSALDYYGGYDNVLTEFSELLPAKLYEK